MLATALLSTVSCSEENDVLDNLGVVKNAKTGGNPNLFERGENEEPDKMTVLGEQITNPYTVAVMTQAYNNLYEPDEARLPATDLYVRFLPQDGTELKRLDELGVDLDDTPYDYHIAEEGHYYHDPALPPDGFTWLYAVVDAGFAFPGGIQYEILAELVLAPYGSDLTKEAHRLTGNAYRRPVQEEEACPYSDPDYPECLCNEANPNYPQCQYCEWEHPDYPYCLQGDYVWDSSGGGTVPNEPEPARPTPCDPTTPNWPDCTMVPIPPGTIFAGPAYTTSDCGCTVSTNPYKPAGCIKVWDTQLGEFVGVRGVRVQVRHIFDSAETYTDENGCFRFDRTFPDALVATKMKIKYKGSKAKIKGVRQGHKILPYFNAVEDEFGLSFPYNNIEVRYNVSSNPHSRNARYWMAATTNNALQEFYDYAQEDGFNTPPNGLDILLSDREEAAAAPMFDKLGFAKTAVLFPDWLTFVMYSLNTLISQISPLLSTLAISGAPDIYMAYGDNFPLRSDQIKETLYHEFAHASHYTLVGSDYWFSNVGYVVDVSRNDSQPDPYGDGTLPGADLTTLIEAWGYHIGPTYADRTYGLLHSNFAPGLTAERGRFISLLEGGGGLLCQGDPCDFRFAFDIIPQGLMNDLIDDNATDYPANWEDPFVVDNVSGYSNGIIFQGLTNGNLDDFKDYLKSNPQSGTETDINNLYEGYDLD